MGGMLAPRPGGHKGDAKAPWQRQLARTPREVDAVLEQLGWDDASTGALREASRRFELRVTEHYLGLADPSDPDDPILAQVLPDARELHAPPPGFSADAVGDLRPDNHPAATLVHKYPGRALLVTTGLCAVNCRFCFRRAYPYEETREGPAAALQAIRSDPGVREVILSGGDPLALSDRALGDLLAALASIDHVRRVRIHTRLPVVLPARVTPELLVTLRSTRLRPWVVTHFNHPRELAPEALEACDRLIGAGVPLLNQSVLLRRVNDDVEVLAELFERLADAGIKPYYLHQLDRVVGAAHFEVPEARGREIVEALRRRISGVALPAWVRDLPGQLAKTPLAAFALLALLLGCGDEPTRLETSLGEVSADEVITPEPTASVRPAEAVARTLPPLERVDLLLAADLDGDGAPELLAGAGHEMRWARWPSDADGPTWEGRWLSDGVLQQWLAVDLDGDGRDEVVAAFGVGRDAPQAVLEVVLLDRDGTSTVVVPMWRAKGERNQVTALLPWPNTDGTTDIYVAAFEDRFMVRGGVLSRLGGQPDWLPGHALRMGMARAAADFDGDGSVEVAIGRLYGETKDSDGDLRVLRADGSHEVVPTLRGVRAVGAGDVDGDGVPDLLFGDGWHKRYGTEARFRPSVARPDGAGGWTVELIEERDDQYAVEQIGVASGRLVAGGNREVRVYSRGQGGYSQVGQAQATSLRGAWAALGDRLVTGGPEIRSSR